MNVNKKLIFNIIMVIVNFVLLGIVFVMFNGCANKEVLIQREEVKKPALNIKNPEPLEMKDVTFFVINKENAESVFSELQKQKKEEVLFGVEPTDYENLALNVARIKKYIIEQQAIINAYKTYYEPEVK